MLRVSLIIILLLEICLLAIFQWHVNHLERWLPSLVQSTLSEQLGNHPFLGDLKLNRLELHLSNSSHIAIPGFDAGNAVMQLKLVDARLNLINSDITAVDANSLSVEIASLDVKLNLDAFNTSTDATSDAQSIADVKALALPYLSQVPRYGVIEQFKVCLSGVTEVLSLATDNGCISGGLKWRQVGGRVLLDLFTSKGVLLFDISDEHISISGRYQSVPISVSIDLKPVEVQLVATIAKPIGVIDLKSILPNGLDVLITQPKVTVDAVIDAQSTLDFEAIKQSLRFNLGIEFMTRWKFLSGDIEVHSDSQALLKASATYNLKSEAVNSERLDILLQSSLLGQFKYPGVTRGEWALTKGMLCVIEPTQLFQIETQCSLPHFDMAATIAEMDVSVAVDAVLIKDRAANDVEATLRLDVAPTNWNNGLVLSSWFEATLAVEKQANLLTAKSLDAKVLELLNLEFQFNHDLETEVGSVAIQYASDYRPLKPLLGQLDVGDVSLSSGDIDVASRISWQLGEVQQLESETKLQLTNFDFSAQEFGFEGVQFEIELSGWPLLSTTVPAVLSASEVNIGIPINELKVSFDAAADVFDQSIEVVGKNFTANILSGSIQSSDFSLTPLSGDGEVLLEVKSLSLPAILDLEKQDLKSSGLLSGSVPIQIRSANLSVNNGLIIADAPGGFIRYQPDASVSKMMASNQALKIVTDIMKDFQYQHLQAEVAYTEAGDLTAKTRIEGNNPEFENGRQVNLNLNLEENLKTLLESLRLGDRITESVTDRVTNEEH